MSVTFDFMQIGIILLFILAVAIAVYLLIAIKNMNAFFKRVNLIAELNSENINKTLALLPDCTRSVNSVAVGLGSGIQRVNTVVDSLDTVLMGTLSAVGNGAENIMDIASLIGGLFRNIFSGISHRKPRSKKKAV